MARAVADPNRRSEASFCIDAEVDGGRITRARAFCTMCRGLPRVLVGRDPRDAWAFTQRICGVCTAAHAHASIRAVEDALGIEIPPLAQAFRNLMIATQNVHDHTMHFYRLHAHDWVDIPSALKADPKATSDLARSISTWRNASEGYYTDLLARLRGFASGGRPGLFANAYGSHPSYRLPPELNLLGVAHSLEALDWQRHVIRILTFLGGEDPHPNFLVGGVPFSVDLSSPAVVNARVLAEIKSCIESIQEFVREVYVPDLLAVAGFYQDWLSIGAGVGNFLSYGELPGGKTKDASRYFLPRGALVGRSLDAVEDVNPDEVLRWRGRPMEVGPHSRMLVAYAQGHPGVREKVDAVRRRFQAPPTVLDSTLGRTAARGIEAWLLSDYLSIAFQGVMDLARGEATSTFSAEHWDPRRWPKRCEGSGLVEAPRGSLGHRVVIRDRKIARYHVVAPSAWNAGSGGAKGPPGPYEAALAGTPILNPKEPVEILRTVRSFDPCLACACHVRDASGREVAAVSVQ